MNMKYKYWWFVGSYIVVAILGYVIGEERTILRLGTHLPFWQSLWFRVLVLGILFFGYLVRVHKMKAHRKILECKVKERTRELQEAKAFSESILNNVPEVIYSADAQMRLTYISPKCESLTGYTAEAFLREQCLFKSLIHPDDLETIINFKQTLIANKDRSAIPVEYRIITRNGELKWLRQYITPGFDDKGHLERLDASMYDITELKKTEQNLRESEERHRLLIETMNEGMVVLDKELHVTYSNTKFCEVLGYEKDEIVGHVLTDFVDETSLQYIQCWVNHPKKKRKHPFEIEWTRKDGGRVPTIFSPRPILCGCDAAPECQEYRGSFAVITDISHIKKMEQEQTYLAAIIENSDDVASIRDLDGRAITVNTAFLQIVGKTLPDIIGKRGKEVFKGIIDDKTIQAWEEEDAKARTLEQGQFLAREDAAVLLDGSTRTMYTKIFPVFDTHGSRIATASISTDITEMKQMQEQLIDANIELKETLKNLRRAQAELIQAEKMAALGQLIAGVAHEINTPLGAIRASIENISSALDETLHHLPELFQRLSSEQQHEFFALIDHALKERRHLTSREERQFRRALEEELDEQGVSDADDIADTLVDMGVYEHVTPFVPLLSSEGHDEILRAAYNLVIQQSNSRNILMAVERVSKIVFALKSYGRFDESGERVQASITQSIEVVLTLYHNQLKHGIEVNKHYDDVPDLSCFPDELNQVWTNLIHNAIQAMDGKGHLEISVTQKQKVEDSQSYIVVDVNDSGHGIPEHIRERIFDPFFTTRPQGEGSGLGLDIVRKIVEKHHGWLEVESQPGATTFSVWLPIL